MNLGMRKKIILNIVGENDKSIKFRKNMGGSSGYTSHGSAHMKVMSKYEPGNFTK